MATMVINGATNMKIAAQKAALQNLRLQINNKTGQEIALGQVFKGIVEGRKFPKYDLCLGTDGYYANEMLLTAPDSNHILFGIVGLNYAWIKRSVTEPDTSIDKEYEMFLLFLFYYLRQARNFKSQMFLTSKYQSASMVQRKNHYPK